MCDGMCDLALDIRGLLNLNLVSWAGTKFSILNFTHPITQVPEGTSTIKNSNKFSLLKVKQLVSQLLNLAIFLLLDRPGRP